MDDSSRNITVQDLVFTSDYQVPRLLPNPQYPNDPSKDIYHKTAPSIISGYGSNITLQRCDFGYLNGGADAGNVNGLLFQDNHDVKKIQGYFLFTGDDPVHPSSVVAIYNTCTLGSQLESCMRMAANGSYILVGNNTLSVDPTDSAAKSALRLQSSSFAYAVANDLTGSGNWVGPLPGGDGNSTNVSQYVVFDSNTMEDTAIGDNNFVRLDPGLSHAVLRNNIFKGRSAISISGEDNRSHDNIVQDVWVVNNTRIDPTGKDAKNSIPFLRFASSSADGYMRLKNFHFANNLAAVSEGMPLRETEGIQLAALQANYPSTSTRLTWAQELIGTLPSVDSFEITGNKSRWWVTNNVWPVLVGFSIDNSRTKDAVAWNNLWHVPYGEKPNNISSLVDLYASYRPTSNRPNIGSRAIYATTNSSKPNTSSSGTTMQVAAWDKNGYLRPLEKVTVGAIERNPIGTGD